jgi:hypothetical protein
MNFQIGRKNGIPPVVTMTVAESGRNVVPQFFLSVEFGGMSEFFSPCPKFELGCRWTGVAKNLNILRANIARVL